ncbi:MAG: NAD-dependent epimerase/dehydratase family protein [Kiritimatiellae bacterium]|nr:NAD-dependent epimerase/dehydratase family protein [Kiritimatiellia bacterium]
MQIDRSDHIVVTGATGFLGHHLLPVLRTRYPQVRITPLCSKDYELMDPAQVEAMFIERVPTVVVHLAGLSGGIGVNTRRPADLFHWNLLLTENLFSACAAHGVRKLVYPMGGCAYPAGAASPVSEAQMWNGRPDASSAGYAMAKRMGLVASAVYRQQYGLTSVVLVPGKMYGEHDNYSLADSHVIPALIRRCHEAKRANAPAVTLWGSGAPKRDFVYAGDVANCIPFFIDHDEYTGPVNISSGTATTIRDLADLIARLSGFDGRLEWDAAKPEGQLESVFDVSLLNSLGLSCDTGLDVGLRRTIEWFAANYDTPGAVRL